MHSCLVIPEIVELICSSMDDEETPSSDLLHLALTSVVFCNPALDALWTRQAWELTDLKEIVPSSVHSGSSTSGPSWSRFHFYAKKVRKLVYYEPSPVDLETNTVNESFGIKNALAGRRSALEGEALFPNLTSLSVYAAPLSPESFRVFAGPELKDLQIWCFGPLSSDETSAVKTAIVSSLSAAAYPKLETLSFGIPVRDVLLGEGLPAPHILALIHAFVTSHPWRHLSLPVEGLRPESFRSLSLLPHLNTLYLHHWPMDDVEDYSPSLFVPGFSALRKLDVKGGLDYLELLLDTMAHPNLEEFHNDLIPSFPFDLGQSMEAICQAMARNIAPSSLRRFEAMIERGSWRTAELDQPDHLFGDITPLLVFTRMESVMITYGVDFNDALVTQMAMAWPNLRTLQISNPNHHPTCTPLGLIQLANGCPVLIDLGMSIDANHPLPENIPCSRSLRSLAITYVNNLPQATQTEFTSWLMKLFPNINTATFFCYSGQWEEDRKLYKDHEEENEIEVGALEAVNTSEAVGGWAGVSGWEGVGGWKEGGGWD